MHSFIHFPPSSDTEAYANAILPTLHSNLSTLSKNADACQGSQISNAVADGTLLLLFNFWSMSGGIIFRTNGPLGWLGERQNWTSLSSCKAKNHATSATSKKLIDFCNLCRSMT
jgi:hypothetical protein